MRNCCKENINVLKENDNLLEIKLNDLILQVKKLINDTNCKMLIQDNKIAECVLYVKDNLDNSLRSLLDNLESSGKLDEMIVNVITDMEPKLSMLESEQDKFYVYAPSLFQSETSESIALVKNDKVALLFDVGLDTSASRNLSFLKNKLDTQKLDAIILSHFHNDHVGGLSTMLSLLKRGGIVYLPMDFQNYYNGSDDSETIVNIRNDVLNLLNKNKIPYIEVCKDTTLDFNNIKLKLFNSNEDAYTYYNEHNSRYNAYSMNALVTLGNSKVLFPGDSLIDTQDYLLTKNLVEKVNLYATNHHGYERRANVRYFNILNPDYEYFSICPKSWDSVSLLNYDYTIRTNPIQFTTESFGEIGYVVTRNSCRMIRGFYVKENMFINKELDIYVNPNYNGTPTGTSDRPFRTLSQAFSYLPKENANITIHLKGGVYENIRFIGTSNVLQFVSDENNVTFKNLQMNSNNALYFNDIKFIGNVNISYSNVYFSSCNFECEDTISGNICVSGNRSNISFSNCNFKNAYTGIYAQSGNMITSVNCTFNVSTYAMYIQNSIASITGYTLTSGIFREEEGGLIKTISRGNSTNVPVFNNSNYMRGYMYLATNLGIPLFYFNHDGVDHWKNANGEDII